MTFSDRVKSALDRARDRYGVEITIRSGVFSATVRAIPELAGQETFEGTDALIDIWDWIITEDDIDTVMAAGVEIRGCTITAGAEKYTQVGPISLIRLNPQSGWKIRTQKVKP